MSLKGLLRRLIAIGRKLKVKWRWWQSAHRIFRLNLDQIFKRGLFSCTYGKKVSHFPTYSVGNRKCFLHLALGPNYYITIWCEKVNESVWRILWNNGKRSFLDKTDPFQSRIWAETHLLHFYFFFRMEEKKGFCEIESLLLITKMKLKTKKHWKNRGASVW